VPKTVSQKRFVKGIDNAVGTLSQQPGALTRMSNLLLTQRGSLQTCDGTASIGQIPTPFTTPASIGAFTKYASGQYPLYPALSNTAGFYLTNVTNFSASPVAGAGNAAGTYYFVIVANGSYGSLSGLNTFPVQATMVTGSTFSGVTFQWTAVPYATSYDIYYITASGLTVGNKIVAGTAGTLSGGYLTATYSGSLTTGATNIPQSNNSYLLQYLVGSVSPPNTNVVFSAVTSGVFPSQAPQPAQLAPGDPNFAFNTISTSTQTYTPSTSAASVGVTASSSNVSPSQTGTMSGFPSTSISTSQNVTLYVVTNGSVSSSGSASGYGLATYQYSLNSGATWATFATEGGGLSANWNTTLSVSIPTSGLSNLNTVQVRVTAQANWYYGAGASISTNAVVTNTYITTQLSQSFSPYGGVTGLACNIPQMLQFANYNILILGNGYAPQESDPTKLSSATPTALTNSFQAAYPTWASGTSWITGSQLSASGYIFTAAQGGVSGSSAPSWNTTVGAETADGSVVWKCISAVTTIVAPRGAAHGVVYAGSLWLANTSPATTSDQLDGPTVIKMSDANNPNSWNPINTAFIGRDDGSQITGIQPFTIAAVGISPTGSIAVFKEFQTYQIIGLFGSTNFEIQAAQTDMGCLAARTIQFIPGFGVVRFSHLGFAVYDGVNDRLISEEIRPYLFGGRYQDSDITPVDMQYVYLSKSTQSVQPPMYMCAMPLQGNSGALTRVFCYDLILKAWVIIDLPWAISSLDRVRAGEGNPLVLAGKTDGTVQRMQAGDTLWNGSTAVNWSFRTPDVFGEGSSQRLFFRDMVLRGYATSAIASTVTVVPTVDGSVKGALSVDIVPQATNSNQFEARVSLWLNGQVAHLDISGSGSVVVDSIDWSIEPKATTARRVIG
jgi:hypothetical protein